MPGSAPGRDRPLVVMIGGALPPPYGGIARYLQLVVPALAKRGFRVRMLLDATGIEPDPLQLPSDADVAIAVFHYPGLLRFLGYLARRPFLLGTLLGWFFPAFLARPAFAARQFALAVCAIRSCELLVGKDRPAIVHAFDWPWAWGVAAVLLARRQGARSMVSLFGDVLPHKEELMQLDAVSRPFIRPSRLALERADLTASMTDHCRDLVRHVGLSPDRVARVRVAGDMRPFNPDVDGAALRARHTNDNGALILFVGHVRPRKGPQVLVNALTTIRERHPEARAVFVGPDFGFTAELKVLAERLGVAETVDFVGTVSDRELPEYYAAADVFVFPTTTTIECLGLTFVQAMFAGIPVVATRIAGAPEVIRDGVDGFLVEPGNPNALADRVNELLAKTREERTALGLRGRARAADLLDEPAVVGDLLGAYDRLLGRAS